MHNRKQSKRRGDQYAAVSAVVLAGIALGACADSSARSSVDLSSDIFAPGELTPLTCGSEEPQLELVALPDGPRLKFFHQIESPCALDDSTQILLLNRASEHIVVERVGTSGDRFAAHAADLPKDLAAGETLAIEISFRSAEPGDIGSLLAVSGPGGCSKFKLTGHSASRKEGVVSLSAYHFDFGTIPPDSLSDEQELRIASMPPTEGNVGEPEGISTSTSDWIIGAPRVERTNGCALTTIPIRFMASGNPGLATGALGWEVDSTTSDGEMFMGLQAVELRATVR